MMWKKNFLNVFMWLVYFLGIGTAMMYYIYSTAMEKNPAGIGVAASLSVITLGGVFLLFFLFRFVVSRLPYRDFFKRKEQTHVIEGILFIAMITAGLALRIWNLKYASGNTGYFELAKVTQNGSIPQIAHGATFFYTYLLRILFLVVGNQWIAGIWLQLILQIIAAILFYFGIRKLSGATAGLVCLSMVMLLPQEIMRGLRYSPDILYLCIYAIGLLLTAYFICSQIQRRSWRSVILLIFTGVWMGFVCYLDVTGLTLLVLALTAVCVKGAQKGRSLLYLVCLFLVTLLCFFGYLWFDALTCSKGIPDILNAWVGMYGVKAQDMWFWYAKDDFVTRVAMLGLMIFSSFGFWVSGKKQRFTPWILLFSAMCVMGYLHIYTQNMDMESLGFLMSYVMIGVGIREGLGGSKESDCKEAKEMTEEFEEQILPEDDFEEEPDMEETPVIEEQPRPVEYIQNPLPMPKRHVKKVLDYTFQPDEEIMYFDVEVSEEDDFDL